MRDDEVPGWWRRLGLPGLVDVHVHFLPDPAMNAVWDYFDRAERLATLQALGVRAFPALVYPHKPGSPSTPAGRNQRRALTVTTGAPPKAMVGP